MTPPDPQPNPPATLDPITALEQLLKRARMQEALRLLASLELPGIVQPRMVTGLVVEWITEDLSILVQGVKVIHQGTGVTRVAFTAERIHGHPQLHELLAELVQSVLTSDDLHVINDFGSVGGTTSLPCSPEPLTLLLSVALPELAGLHPDLLRHAVTQDAPELTPLMLGLPTPMASDPFQLGVTAATGYDALNSVSASISAAEHAITRVLGNHSALCAAQGLNRDRAQAEDGWNSTGARQRHGPLG